MNYTLVKNTTWLDLELNSIVTCMPCDWTRYSLGQVTESKISQTSPAKNKLFTYIDIGSVDNHLKRVTGSRKIPGESAPSRARQNVTTGDVLVSTTRPNLNAVAILDSEHHNSICSTGFQVLRAKKEIIPAWIYALVKSLRFVDHTSSLVEGALYPTVSSETIRNYEFILPLVEEQTAIANILSDQESLIAHCDDLITLHTKRLAYLSDELLSGRLRLEDDAEGGVRVVMNDEWQEVEVNDEMVSVPVEWHTNTLNSLCRLAGGISAPKHFKQRNAIGVVPFYRVSNLSSRSKYLTSDNTTEFLEGSNYKKCPTDSILIAKSGESIKQFYRSILKQPSVVVGHIAALLPLQDGNFLFHWLCHFKPENVLIKDSTMPSLGLTELALFQVFYPPLPEQTAIANVLSDQEALITQYKTLRDAEKKRFDWLSDALLSGTYRVKVKS